MRRAIPQTLGLVVASMVLLVGRPALAYRPFDGTDAAVAKRGEFELELGPVGYLYASKQHILATPAAIANVGFADNWELVLQGRELVSLDSSPHGARGRLVDTGAFLKGVLRQGTLQEKAGPSVAVELGPLLPTVNDELGIGFSAAMVVSVRGAWGSLHANAAVARARSGNADIFTGLIAEAPYAWRARPVVEIFYEREFASHETWSVLNGAIVRLSEDVALDAGVRLSRVDNTNAAEVRAGFTWATRIWGGT